MSSGTRLPCIRSFSPLNHKRIMDSNVNTFSVQIHNNLIPINLYRVFCNKVSQLINDLDIDIVLIEERYLHPLSLAPTNIPRGCTCYYMHGVKR